MHPSIAGLHECLLTMLQPVRYLAKGSQKPYHTLLRSFLGGVGQPNTPSEPKLIDKSSICYANITPSMNHAQLGFNVICERTQFHSRVLFADFG